MKAINEILQNTDYDDRITTKYLQALEIKNNSSYRVATIEGFRHPKDYKLKESLAYLKDDPSKEVREMMEQLYTKPPKTEKYSTRIQMSLFYYLRHLVKNRGKPPTQKDVIKAYFKKESTEQEQIQQKKIKRFKLKYGSITIIGF